jgi:hypothetical protein
MAKGWFKVHHQVVKSVQFKALTPSTKVLYLYLCQLNNQFNHGKGFTRGERQLSRYTGLSRNTVATALQSLSDIGAISITKHHAKSRTRITLYIPGSGPTTEPDVAQPLGQI